MLKSLTFVAFETVQMSKTKLRSSKTYLVVDPLDGFYVLSLLLLVFFRIIHLEAPVRFYSWKLLNFYVSGLFSGSRCLKIE